MSTSFESKDSQVRGVQLKVQTVMIKADLEAGTSDEPSLVTINNAGAANCSIDVDIKEDVKKVVKAAVFDNKSGDYEAQSAAASASGSVISIGDVDASTPDLSDVTIEVHYEVE